MHVLYSYTYNMINRKGFTLAELLIAVAIVGVLTGIAIPLFSYAVETGKENADSNVEKTAKMVASVEFLNQEGTQSTAGIYYYNASTAELLATRQGISAYGQGTESGSVKEDHTQSILSVIVDTDGNITTSWTSSGIVSAAMNGTSTIQESIVAFADSSANSKYLASWPIDSTDTSASADYVRKNFTQLFNQMNVVSWKIEKDSSYTIPWVTDVDITSVPVGTWVRVIRYNPNKKYLTYTAAYELVQKASDGSNQLAGGTGATVYHEIVGQDSTTKRDYTKTVSIYNSAPASGTTAELAQYFIAR